MHIGWCRGPIVSHYIKSRLYSKIMFSCQIASTVFGRAFGLSTVDLPMSMSTIHAEGVHSQRYVIIILCSAFSSSACFPQLSRSRANEIPLAPRQSLQKLLVKSVRIACRVSLSTRALISKLLHFPHLLTNFQNQPPFHRDPRFLTLHIS